MNQKLFFVIASFETAPPRQEHNSHPLYRPDIDGLRALAILPVMAFHAASQWVPGGFVGVDIFFVISGFLISVIIFRSLANNDFRFTEFYAHRIKRIFPALILVLASCYVLGWYALLPDEFKQLGMHMMASVVFVQNFVLWHEAGYFDNASILKPLMHLWSLAIEEQFYLIYPLLIWAIWQGRRLTWSPKNSATYYPWLVWAIWRYGENLLVVIAVLALLSLSFNATGIHHDVVGTFFAPHTRFWELMAGALLAYFQVFKCWPAKLTPWGVCDLATVKCLFFSRQPTETNFESIFRSILSFCGLLLILAAIFGLSREQPYPGLRALLPVLGACFLIVAGSSAWVNRKLLANKLMVWVGLISYPLYLWHWPLLSFAHIVEEKPSGIILAAAVVFSFVLAALTYWFIEKPVRFGRISWRKTAILCVLAVLVGYAGYNTYRQDGLASRESLAAVAQRTAMFEQKTVQGYVDDACKQRYGYLSPGFCRLGKDAAPTVLLAGDSHAAALFSGLRDVMEKTQNNVVLLGNGGCVPFFDVSSYAKEQAEKYRHNCSNTITGALHAAETTASIHTVILASSAPLYLFSDLNHYESQRYQLEYLTHPDITSPYKVWEAALRDTLSRLQAKGKRIIVVLDNPELMIYYRSPTEEGGAFAPQSCVDTRPLRITDQVLKQPCAVSRKDFDKNFKYYRDLMFSVLKDYPTVKVVDVAATLCDEKWCWIMKDDGNMLYHDSGHLSLEGSRLVAAEFAKLLAAP